MPNTNPGMFLSRQLEQQLPKLYEKRYPMLWADEGMYLPAVGDLEMGAQSIIEETVAHVGEAAIMAAGANDVPLSDAIINETSFKAVCIAAAVKYSIPELNAAAKAGRDLRTERMKAADLAIRQRTHKLAAFGSSNHGMTGFLNDANVTTVSSSYDADNGATTASDHVDFVRDQLKKVQDDTNLTEEINTILVPSNLAFIWQSTEMPGSGKSVLNFIKESFTSLQVIAAINEAKASQLEANGVKSPGDNEDRLIFLSSNPDTVERKFYGRQILAPQQNGMDYYSYMYTGTSEVIWHYPGSCLYVDIPTVA